MIKHCRGCFEKHTVGTLRLKGVKCSIQSHVLMYGAQTESDYKPYPTLWVSPAVPRKTHWLTNPANRNWRWLHLWIPEMMCYWQSMHAKEVILPWRRGTGSRMKLPQSKGKRSMTCYTTQTHTGPWVGQDPPKGTAVAGRSAHWATSNHFSAGKIPSSKGLSRTERGCPRKRLSHHP